MIDESADPGDHHQLVGGSPDGDSKAAAIVIGRRPDGDVTAGRRFKVQGDRLGDPGFMDHNASHIWHGYAPTLTGHTAKALCNVIQTASVMTLELSNTRRVTVDISNESGRDQSPGCARCADRERLSRSRCRVARPQARGDH